MAKTMIDNRLYNDAWFFSLSPKAKWLFLFLITNETCNLIGCYEMPQPIISQYTGLTAKELNESMEHLQEKAIYTEGWVIIKNYAKYNPMRNPSVEIAKQKQEDTLPEKIREAYENFIPCRHPAYTLSTPCSDHATPSKVTVPVTETVTVMEIEKIKKNKYNTYDSLGQPELEAIAEKYHLKLEFVQDCHDDMGNWLKSKGKTYKDYYAALANWVKRDAERYVERRIQGNVRPAVDATGLSKKRG